MIELVEITKKSRIATGPGRGGRVPAEERVLFTSDTMAVGGPHLDILVLLVRHCCMIRRNLNRLNERRVIGGSCAELLLTVRIVEGTKPISGVGTGIRLRAAQNIGVAQGRAVLFHRRNEVNNTTQCSAQEEVLVLTTGKREDDCRGGRKRVSGGELTGTKSCEIARRSTLSLVPTGLASRVSPFSAWLWCAVVLVSWDWSLGNPIARYFI